MNIAVELDLGAGPIDMLALDGGGRIVIVEFKRGSENPDVRRVVAQMLDYGSALWRTPYKDLKAACARLGKLEGDSLLDHMTDRLSPLGDDFDGDAFRTGLTANLESADYVFLLSKRAGGMSYRPRN